MFAFFPVLRMRVLLVAGLIAVTPFSSVSQRAKDIRNIYALPLSFEQNQGQADSQVRFLFRGAGFSAFFKGSEADFLLSKQPTGQNATHQTSARRQNDPHNETSTVNLLRMQLLHANSTAVLSGADRLPGTVNYFVGNDPSQWHTGVPTFGQVRYTDVYPGVNLVYYGNRQRLEFDFELAPGADAGAIQFRFDGSRRLKLDHEGNLVVSASNGDVSFRRPLIYQPIADAGKQFIEGSFVISADNSVRFALGSYDHAKPLIIDPILNYSTYLGPTGAASSIAVDSAGNVYIAGSAALGMSTTAGAFQSVPATKPRGDGSAFVAKLNNSGTALLYCTYLSGNLSDWAIGIAIDVSGNTYIAGQTTSTNFPVTTGAFQTANHASNVTSFVAEINSTGTQLLYSTYLGGSSRTEATGIAVDKFGDAFVTGETLDTDFPTTKGSLQPTPKITPLVNLTGFVTELNPAGTSLVYSTYLSGTGADFPIAITVDADDNAYLGGFTSSTDFPTTAGAYQVAIVGDTVGHSSGFITKINPAGSQLVYSTLLGGEYNTRVLAIALDASNNAYVTGLTLSPDFPVTAGVFQPMPQGLATGGQDSFVTKLNSAGSALVYSSFLGEGFDTGEAIAVDLAGNAYVAGNTLDLDFPVTPGALQVVNRETETTGDGTCFLTKINPSASQIVYSTYLGGSGEGESDGLESDSPSGIALDSSANVYLAGTTVSSDFPTTPGVLQIQNLDTDQIAETFVTEFNASEMKTLPATATLVTSNINPQMFGQPVTITATVQPSSGSTPTGTVAFSVNNSLFQLILTPWSSVALNGSGSASYTFTPVLSGPIPVNVYYLGDTNNAPSTGAMTETVTQIPTVTTLASSANPVVYGTPVTFTATAMDNTGKPVNGFVMFLVGNTSYAQVNLDNTGKATWVNGTGGPVLPAGTDTVTVKLFPNSTGYQQTSASLTETFTPLGTTPSPTFTPLAGNYYSAQQVALSDTNTSASIYFTTDGSTPGTGGSSRVFVTGMTITVNATETIKAIAMAPGYINSSVAAATYIILPPNPAPILSSISPGFSSAGGATFTLTVTGTGFVSGSTVYWGTTALATTYGSATQLTAQVTAAEIASAGITAITMQTPAPGGGTSSALQFEVDSADSGSTPPTFTTVTATVTAGSPASYPVTLPSTVESASVTCLNLPTGVTCSYSATTNTLTITTSSTTPKGTYQVTVVFSETVSGAASGYILLPILLLPLIFLRRKLAAHGVWVTACLGLVLLAAAAYSTGCGGGGGGTTTTPPPQTHQAVSSGTISITVQ